MSLRALCGFFSTFRRFGIYTVDVRKPGTDESNVQMSDVLCDFCHRQWTEDVAMLEGHHGSCICSQCVTVAYTDVVVHKQNSTPAEYKCSMCLEATSDRAALNRADEPGWQSPAYPEAVICGRCIELAAKSLERDKDSAWSKPTAESTEES